MDKGKNMLKRFESANRNGSLLSQWEKGFIESLTEQFNKRGRLSPKQIEIFERIETQKLSKTAQEASQKWAASYDDEKRRIALICAKYYLTAGYFTALAMNIVEDASFVPSEKAWKKMCQNKYALKVVAAYDAAPKYAVGSVVRFRATADWVMKIKANDMPCVVISSGGYVLNAAKGAKPYKVLPYGSVQMIECEERHIKKGKKNLKKTKKTDTYDDVPF